MSHNKARAIRDAAWKLGFQVMGVAVPPLEGEYGQRYLSWLHRGFHADMDYLARKPETRLNPSLTIPRLRSVVVLAMSHHHQRPPDPEGATGMAARHAWGRDYHNVIGKRLRKLGRMCRSSLGASVTRTSVDNRPVLERAWALQSGIGVRGANCCVITPRFGSHVFLATLMLDLVLPPTRPPAGTCNGCGLCIAACPTGALREPGVLDSRECISYHTVESRKEIPQRIKLAMGRRVLGCEACQEACPMNNVPMPGGEPAFAPRPEQVWPDLHWLMHSSDEELHRRFTGTAYARPGPVFMKRNAAIVLGNLRLAASIDPLGQGLLHPSPVVRTSSAWAALRCGGRLQVEKLWKRESDPGARPTLERYLDGHG